LGYHGFLCDRHQSLLVRRSGNMSSLSSALSMLHMNAYSYIFSTEVSTELVRVHGLLPNNWARFDSAATVNELQPPIPYPVFLPPLSSPGIQSEQTATTDGVFGLYLIRKISVGRYNSGKNQVLRICVTFRHSSYRSLPGRSPSP